MPMLQPPGIISFKQTDKHASVRKQCLCCSHQVSSISKRQTNTLWFANNAYVAASRYHLSQKHATMGPTEWGPHPNTLTGQTLLYRKTHTHTHNHKHTYAKLLNWSMMKQTDKKPLYSFLKPNISSKYFSNRVITFRVKCLSRLEPHVPIHLHCPEPPRLTVLLCLRIVVKIAHWRKSLKFACAKQIIKLGFTKRRCS